MTEEEYVIRWGCQSCKSLISMVEFNYPTKKCDCGGEYVFLSTTDEEGFREFNRMKLFECYERIMDFIEYYMDTTEENKKIIAIWIIGTYFHKEFSSYPFLFFNAMRGSGKSRMLRIVSYLMNDGNGELITSLTEAVLFRSKKNKGLAIDESESLGSKEKAILKECLCSSYKRGGTVQRNKKVSDKSGENYILQTFEMYRPITLANIWGLDDVLADRSITIILEKSDNPLKVKKQENFENNPEIEWIKRTLSVVCRFSAVSVVKKDVYKRWNNYIEGKYINDTYTLTTLTTLNYTTTLKQQILEKEEEDAMFFEIDKTNIDGRHLEIFFPLFLTSYEISSELFKEILEISISKVDIRKDDEISDSRDAVIYEFVSSLSDRGLQYLPMKEIAFQCRTFAGDDEITDKSLGRSLKRLNLVLDKKRLASGRFVILNYAKAHEKLKIFKSKEKLEVLQ